MEDSCPFCTIEKLKTDIAMLEEANRTGNQHDDELISEARKQTAQECVNLCCKIMKEIITSNVGCGDYKHNCANFNELEFRKQAYKKFKLEG